MRYQCKPTNQSILGIGRTYIDLQGKEHVELNIYFDFNLGISLWNSKKAEEDRSMSPVKAYLIKAWPYRLIEFPKLRSRSRGTRAPFPSTSQTLSSTYFKSTRSISEPMEEPQSLRSLFASAKEQKSALGSRGDTNAESYRHEINATIAKFQECQRQVSMLSLFSSNELLEDISTSDIQYGTLIPALRCPFS